MATIATVARLSLLLEVVASWVLPGWKELHDDTGRLYYLNQRTGKTSWHPMLAPRFQGACSNACGSQSCGDWLIDKASSLSVRKTVACDLGHIALLKECPRTCKKCFVADTACGKSDLLFNCKADGIQHWEERKLRWCCEYRGIGCGFHKKLPSTSTYDCKAGLRESWSKGKKRWCCDVEHTGCRYNCYSQLERWEHSWSLQKRAWCCSRQKLGCISKKFECTEGVLDARHWSEVKRHYCCRFEGVGCAHSHEDIRQEANSTNPKSYVCTGRDWPMDKIKWCCLAKQVGCKMLSVTTSTTTMPELFDCQAGLKSWHLGWSHRKKVWCCKSKHIACAYDCRDHLSTWQVSWSAAQKTFCCATFKVGCVSLGLRPQPQPGHYDCTSRSEGWPVWQQRWCCSNRGLGCEPESLPFSDATQVETLDCSVDGTAWTEMQRWLCCRDHGVGCLETAVHFHPPDPPVPVHVEAGEAHVPTQIFSAAPYHCHSGHERHWSSSKRHFCCTVQNIGCDLHSVLGSFDCNTYDANWETSWSSEQKRICCHHYGMGCPNWHPPQIHVPDRALDVRFDCSAGALPDLWSVAKRAFCCRHESKGCSDAAAPRYECHTDRSGAWPKAKVKWCCEVLNVGCGSLPLKYDCSNKVAEYKAWSFQKQEFCCRTVKVACRKTRPWLQQLLDAPEEQQTTLTTTTVAYDCRAGVKHWKEGWSRSKVTWCCAQRGFGCPYDCKGPRKEWTHDQHAWCCDQQGVGCFVAKFELRGSVEGTGIQLHLKAAAGVVMLLSLLSLVSLRTRYREARDPQAAVE